MNMSTTHEQDVILHVYDLMRDLNDKVITIGFGIFHTGVEVGGKEYWFFGHEFEFTGVIRLNTGLIAAGSMTKRHSVPMGRTALTNEQLEQLINKLTAEYKGCSYHPLKRNCNHFSDEFCRSLVSKSIPGYINRAARFGDFIMKLVPQQVILWVLNKVLNGSGDVIAQSNETQQIAAEPEQRKENGMVQLDDVDVTVEVSVDKTDTVSQHSEEEDNAQFVELLKEAAREDLESQRDLATFIFMSLHRESLMFEAKLETTTVDLSPPPIQIV
mmetsp:Transcript_28142/g.39729  ORF Transcript_28142/g.39729 Transcript_28142/m.39729 type:complete len:271 (-) Transcript_28142:2970-3782(-)